MEKALFFGVNGDSPLAGDFDGDGKDDPIVTRPGPVGLKEWYIWFSTVGSFSKIDYGFGSDRAFAADVENIAWNKRQMGDFSM